MTSSSSLLKVLLSLCASIITAAGNILVIASFFFYRSVITGYIRTGSKVKCHVINEFDRNLRTINNYLILNLAIADLIIGIYSMNVYTVYVIQGISGC